MNFELNQSQKAIINAAREFATKEFDSELAYELEKKHDFPMEIYKKAAKLGFVAPYVDEAYGGDGLGILENAMIVEEFCKADSSIGLAIDLASLPCKFLYRFGNHDQNERYLSKITSGEFGAAIALTEPDHGSDITQMDTVAVKKNGSYLLSGNKTFITNGTIADFYTVLCQTDPDASPKYKGMSILIVDRDMIGKHFQVNELGEKMGIRLTSSAELVFDNLEVPEENLLGEAGRGFYQAMGFFEESKIEIAAQAVGVAQGAFDLAYQYAKERKQFGKPIACFQAMQHKFVDMYLKIENARHLVHKAAFKFDQGHRDHRAAAMAKYYAANIANEVTYDALQVFGGYGYFQEYKVERYYRDARILSIYEGTAEIQKNIIGTSLFPGL
ncbi:acyl-CoA dehydrogenase [Desulfosarcina ovata subsp. sediminis]|uniref:Acyl-CoA dehydrogenase n=1 Tax=Desulfosarcina ovata subsp. sediminis TaxID=885957 RepID=A0A5K7ZMB7_9BACT|nr:acyl-CoA dehydrogenase family protein [Desulfosarcina ovata]BBO82674.1 acyl-CoA dehydrogenase [Desulfosarcina ovata subsp. sediminis]